MNFQVEGLPGKRPWLSGERPADHSAGYGGRFRTGFADRKARAFRENTAHIRQSRPDSGLGFQAEGLKTS